MHNDDQSQVHEQLAELADMAALLATEQQWLAKLHRATQDYLDRPNPVSRGRLTRILGAIERRSTHGTQHVLNGQ